MAPLCHSIVLVTAIITIVLGQTPFSVIPEISEQVRNIADKAHINSFVRLWDYALQVDGQGPNPASRINFEAKTILAPGADAIINLIPQDASDPRYTDSELRRNFLKDHLVLDPIKTSDPDMATDKGVRALTFSGKDVHIKKDDKGKVFVEDIPVSQVLSLKDGTQIYVLDDLLFGHRQRVNDVFNTRFGAELNGPTGAPLDLTGFVPSPQFGATGGNSDFSGFVPVLPPSPPVTLDVRAPAPPLPSDFDVQPPSPPPAFSGALPPALPQPGRRINAPAPPPPGRRISAPAPPPQGNRIGAPAPSPAPIAPITKVSVPAPPPASAGRFNPLPPPPPLSTGNRVSANAPSAPPRGNPSLQFSAPPAPPSPPAPPVSDGAKRIERQLNFPILDDLSSLNPVGNGGNSSDFKLSNDFILSVTSSAGENSYLEQSRSEGIQPKYNRLRDNNRPLSELYSIEQFATLFQLSTSPDEESLVRVLQRAGLVTMLGLLETSGLLQQLVSGEKGRFMLLAPSESAFSKLSRQELTYLTKGNDLLYHVIPLHMQNPNVTNDSLFVTLLGPKLRFNVYDGIVYANGVTVSQDILSFTYGTIQVIDSVLQPPIGDLRGVLVSKGGSLTRINTLLTVVQTFDRGHYTLLAPPDSAISSKGYSWPELLMQRSLGKDLLEKHMFNGTWYSEGLLEERIMTTLAGTSVTFRKEVDGTMTVNGVPMRAHNLSATNGVVHLVADVIPDFDLGSDPTEIPNPLITQAEFSLFENFANGVPEVPTISGLYELPDFDSFDEFIPANSKSAYPVNFGRSDLLQNIQDEHSPFVANSENKETSFSTHQVFDKHPNNEKSTEESSELISLLETLDKASGQLSHDILSNPEEHNLPIFENGSNEIQDINITNAMMNNLALGDQSTTHPINEDFLYDDQNTEDENSISNSFQYTASTRSPNQIITESLYSTTSKSFMNRSDRISTVDTQITHSSDSSNSTIDDTKIQSLVSVKSGGKEETYLDLGPRIPYIPSAEIVTDGPFVWIPENTISDKERKNLDVIKLLLRLNLTRFLELAEIAGLTRTLNLDGPWTLFAPSNKAIEAIPPEALQEMISYPRFLRRVLSYHIVPGKFLSRTDFGNDVHLPTLHAGHTLALSYYTEGPVSRWVAGGSIITNLDEEASNGVVHVLNQVLYAPYGDIITTTSLSPLLTIFSKLAVNDTEIIQRLSGPGPVTLFAPSDDSLRNFVIPEDLDSRRDWLLSHIVNGIWYTAGFSNTWPLISVNSEIIETHISNETENIVVNGIQIDHKDITASNGVLHVVESPLFTPK